jgi:hypothetical protein
MYTPVAQHVGFDVVETADLTARVDIVHYDRRSIEGCKGGIAIGIPAIRVAPVSRHLVPQHAGVTFVPTMREGCRAERMWAERPVIGVRLKQLLRARLRTDQCLRLVDLGTGMCSIGTVAERGLVVERTVADPVARLPDRGLQGCNCAAPPFLLENWQSLWISRSKLTRRPAPRLDRVADWREGQHVCDSPR